MNRWNATGLSTDPPSYPISVTWMETILIDTVEIGISPDPASSVTAVLLLLPDRTVTEAVVEAEMQGDDAAILIDAVSWEIVYGQYYELRTELMFGSERITRTTVLEVLA